MKRILSIAAVFLLAVTMLSFNAFATQEKIPKANTNKKITISEDYKTVYYNNKTYFYHDDFVDYEDSKYIENDGFKLTETQDAEIEHVYGYITSRSIEIVYSFKKGGHWSAVYIKEDVFEKYTNIDYIKSEDCAFWLDSEEEICVAAQKLKSGKSVEFKTREAYEYAHYSVVSEDSRIECGLILADAITEDFYFIYFLDFAEYDGSNFDLMQYDEVTAYKITDKELLEKMRENYYDNEEMEKMEAVSGTEFGMIMSLVVCSLVFAGIPVAIMILSVVFVSMKKTRTKKGYIVTIALCGAELICFIYVIANIIMHW